MRRTPRDSSAGFTLIELLIVVAILALLMSLVLPSLSSGLRNWQLRNMASELVSNLRLARTDSVMKKTVHGVRIDLEHDRIDRIQASALAVAAGELEVAIQEQLADLLSEDRSPVDIVSFGPPGTDDDAAETGAHYVFFYPRGNSTGGRITLKHRDGERTLVVQVAPITGRVEVVKTRRTDL